MEYIEKTLTGVIESGTTSITFTDDFINDNSIIDVYFEIDGITPTNQVQTGNKVIIDILEQSTDTNIAVHITNYDTIDYSNELESLNDTVGEHTTAISNLSVDFDTLENKVDGLNASNINYDEHSTLYSALGDIDNLETTSKNLVGAINEVKGGGVSSTTIKKQRVTINTQSGFDSVKNYPSGVNYNDWIIINYLVYPPSYDYCRTGINPLSGNEQGTGNTGRFFIEMRENGLYIYNNIPTYNTREIDIIYAKVGE